ncbi:MAG: dTDP-4-dehydrorhamnose reductase [Acidimicrobiia bacterium]
MKFLITGAGGQVATACEEIISKADHEAIAVSRDELDISNRDQTLNSIVALKPDFVVNCAAMTNVDACESKVDEAFAVNSLGVRNLVQGCDLVSANLVHLSTDFVFDGRTDRPYSEFDLTNPLSVYAKSKLGGDNEALSYFNSTVLRVAWVYGNVKGDFFKWVIDGVQNGSIKNLIDDQTSTPTYSYDIAQVVLKVCMQQIYGLINVANSGEATRLEMGKEICELLNIDNDLGPISEKELDRPAKRPNYSSLNTDLLKRTTGIVMRDWQETLNDYISRMKEV